MARVYVSSTIIDLKRERRAVMDWLVTAGYQPVHSYLPSSDTVRDSCLDDVATCDLYVLILGHRYGFQPADGNPEGLSITHLEFRRAGQSDIPRIALVRTSIPDAHLSDFDDPQKAPLVSAFRAEVARELRPAEFHDLRGLIEGLSTGVPAELAKRDQRPGGHRVGAPALRLPPRPPPLAGREELLADLDDRLATGEGLGPRVAALCGLGGAGKTSVAVEYAHRHLGQLGVAWQLPAEDATVLAAGFGELAAQLGTGGAAGGGDPVTAVHSALAAYPGEWLLIFDNVPGQGAVRTFGPPAGNGRVLITSQSAVWPPGQAVEVPALDIEVAAVFLVNRTGDPDSQAAAALAGELGGLPLALEQAAAYIETAGTTMAGYLSLFQDRRADLLARGEATGHPETVVATLGLALSQLEADAPAGAGLLRLLACLAPEPIPLTLLLADTQIASELGPEVAAILGPLLGDPIAAGDAITALRRYSLVTPAGDGLVLVHRLVQAVTTDQMSRELTDQWRQAAAALIEAAIPGDTSWPETWPVCAALLPHAQAALADESSGMSRLANYLGYRGSSASAMELQQRVLDALERAHGPEQPDTLAARGSLARWTGEAGHAAAARDQYAALLPVMERVLGPEHRDTLAARGSLADWTGNAGDAAAARDQYAALLPVMEPVLGPEHADVLDVRGSLAAWTGSAGDAAAGRYQYSALLLAKQRVLGPEHPATLVTRNNLAYLTGEADAAAARDQYAALLPVEQRVLGPQHPTTLVTRNNLAEWTGSAGDAAAARDQYAALLPVEQRVLGPENPLTLATQQNLAEWTGEAGDAAAARDQYAALLPLKEQVLGPENWLTLAACGSLARWTGEAGDAAAARDQYAALLPVMERVLGPEHPNTLTAFGSLARWTGEAGDAAAARDRYTALLPVRERVMGPRHPDTMATRQDLAHWTRKADGGSGSGVD